MEYCCIALNFMTFSRLSILADDFFTLLQSAGVFCAASGQDFG